MNKLITFFMVWLLISVLFCGKKQVNTPVLFFDGDTLSRERITVLEPVEIPDSIRYRTVAMRLLCDKRGGQKTPDSITAPFRERISLVSNVEWSDEAASLLLDASAYIGSVVAENNACSLLAMLMDSLCLQVKDMIVPEAAFSVECSTCRESGSDSIQLVHALEAFLGVSSEVAGLISEFLHEDHKGASVVSGKDAKKLIQGLVSSGDDKIEKSSTKPEKQAVNRAVAQPVDNSAATLKYRDHASIRDSISKHIPNLKQLYKKKLKKTSALSGKVVVTLRVAPEGHILSVSIKQTQITDQSFLKPFITYLKTIRFKPIPKKVGAITFDFPFEFNAEM